jgi:thioredoxin 1
MFKVFSVLFLSAFFLSACNTVSETEEVAAILLADSETEIESDIASAEVAANFTTFSQTAYDAAIADGKTIFLDFHANWCPTCLRNAPYIESAFEELNDDNVVGFRVDFDNSRDMQKQFGVLSQSTLVLVRNGDETDTSFLGPGFVSTEEVLAFVRS